MEGRHSKQDLIDDHSERVDIGILRAVRNGSVGDDLPDELGRLLDVLCSVATMLSDLRANLNRKNRISTYFDPWTAPYPRPDRPSLPRHGRLSPRPETLSFKTKTKILRSLRQLYIREFLGNDSLGLEIGQFHGPVRVDKAILQTEHAVVENGRRVEEAQSLNMSLLKVYLLPQSSPLYSWHLNLAMYTGKARYVRVVYLDDILCEWHLEVVSELHLVVEENVLRFTF